MRGAGWESDTVHLGRGVDLCQGTVTCSFGGSLRRRIEVVTEGRGQARRADLNITLGLLHPIVPLYLRNIINLIG